MILKRKVKYVGTPTKYKLICGKKCRYIIVTELIVGKHFFFSSVAKLNLIGTCILIHHKLKVSFVNV